MDKILQLAETNQKKAREVIEQTNVVGIWESIGAVVNLVGSLKTGLMMTHRDIDFHIYTEKLDINKSFSAMAKLAENHNILRIEYANYLDTEEACIEWHAWYKYSDESIWQLDMIHILKGSKYDGYFERVAERIKEVITPKQKETILRLKYETPTTEKIMGAEYYQAVMRDGIETYQELLAWKKQHSMGGIIEWMP